MNEGDARGVRLIQVPGNHGIVWLSPPGDPLVREFAGSEEGARAIIDEWHADEILNSREAEELRGVLRAEVERSRRVIGGSADIALREREEGVLAVVARMILNWRKEYYRHIDDNEVDGLEGFLRKYPTPIAFSSFK